MSAFDTQTACFAEQRCINSGACGMDGGRGAYMVLVGKPEGSRPLERPKHGWEDIKLDLLEIRWMGGMDRIYLAEDKESWWALQNTVMNRQVP